MNRNAQFCVLAVLAATVMALLTGCPGPEKGAIYLNIDLAALEGVDKADAPAITDVTVTLSREDEDTIIENLSISDDYATGVIDDLLEGYWHVKVDVYAGATPLYTGEQDVNVIAGLVVNVTILFDPVSVEPTTGSISFEVGINPLPGFRLFDQAIDAILYSKLRDELYLYDSAQSLIAVYGGESFNRIRDIELPFAPHVICLSTDEDEFVMVPGELSGQLYRLDIASGAVSHAGDTLMIVDKIVSISPDIVLAIAPGSKSNTAKSFNLTTGQIVDTKPVWYSFGDVIYNAATNTVYAYTKGTSPSDLYRIKFDSSTGVMSEYDDSRYHGDYDLGSPLRIFRNGERIATSCGNIFTCTTLAETDLTYVGNIGFPYADLIADDELGYLYVLSNGTRYEPADPQLMIMRQDTFFVEGTVALSGEPVRVIDAQDSIVVIARFEGRMYRKTFSKADLGL